MTDWCLSGEFYSYPVFSLQNGTLKICIPLVPSRDPTISKWPAFRNIFLLGLLLSGVVAGFRGAIASVENAGRVVCVV